MIQEGEQTYVDGYSHPGNDSAGSPSGIAAPGRAAATSTGAHGKRQPTTSKGDDQRKASGTPHQLAGEVVCDFPNADSHGTAVVSATSASTTNEMSIVYPKVRR